MKKLYLSAVLLTAAFLAGSCTVNQIDGEPEEVHNYVTIVASMGEDQTKTRMNADANGYNFAWENGDRIYLTEYNRGMILHNDIDYYNYYESESLKSGGSTATFTLDYGKTEELPDPYDDGYNRFIAAYPNPVVVAYPADVYGSMDFKGDPHHEVFIVEIPTYQCPSEDCFDPDADVMVSDVHKSKGRPASFNFKFARVGAVLKLRLTGLPAGYEVVKGELWTDAQGGDEWGPAYQEAYDPLLKRTSQPNKPGPISFWPDEVYVDEYGVATIWLRVKGGTLQDLTLSCSVYVQEGKSKAKHYGYSVNLSETHQVVPFNDGGCTTITLGCDRIYDVEASTFTAESVLSNGATIPVYFDLDEISYESVTYGICYNEAAISDVPTIETDNCKVAESVDAYGFADIILDNLKSNTEYSYRSYVIVDGEITYSERWYFTTDVSYEAPTPVDLGLPSGVKWSPYNLGANSPEEGGYFFRWGEESAYTFYSNNWYNYKYSSGNYYTFSKYVSNIIVGTTVDHKRVLEACDDPATYNYGDSWRTACKADFEELISNCDLSLEDVNGEECFKFTSRLNSNSIYFPKSGSQHNGDVSGIGEYGKCRCADMDQPIERDMSDGVNCIILRIDNNGDPYWVFTTDSKAEYADAVRPVSGGTGVARQVAWTYEPAAIGTTSASINVKFDLSAVPGGYTPHVNDSFYVLCCAKTNRISYQGKENYPAPYSTTSPSIRLEEITDGSSQMVVISGLTPGTEYVYRARAYLGSVAHNYYGETYSFTTHTE